VAVRLKLNPIREIVEGRKIILVDDSLVRGTTSKKIIELLHKVKAAEIHLLITSPPVLYPCYYGVDTSEREELIAASYDVEGTRQYIGADSLHYLSLDGLLNSFQGAKDRFCTACFNANYIAGKPGGQESY
jgi:amidophosphoribosyltransferase